MTLTKNHLINSIYNDLSIPKKRSVAIVESFLDIMKDTLESGEDVLISGFGKFCVKDKSERKGRNPNTGDDLMMRKRRVVRFRCSGRLRGEDEYRFCKGYGSVIFTFERVRCSL